MPWLLDIFEAAGPTVEAECDKASQTVQASRKASVHQ